MDTGITEVGLDREIVFATRAPLKMLPYSIHEIYEIITDGKRTDIKNPIMNSKKSIAIILL